MKKIILALLLLLMAATIAAADTVYLRDGRTVRGTVLGFMNGRFAVRLTAAVTPPTVMQTPAQSAGTARIAGEIGDIVFIRTRDIERVEIDGRSLDEARYLTRTVQVELGPNWVDTGIDLRRGERVQVTASGVITAGRTRISPGGLRTTDPNAPLPRAAEGVLIGAVGNDPSSPIVEIGLNREFIADRDGRLYLTANRSNYTDARGAFTAQIRKEINFGPRVAGNRRNDGDDQADDFDPFGTGGSGDPAPVRPRTSTGGFGQGVSTTPVSQEKTLVVPGNSRGTDTGIELRSGDSVTITASGNITAGRRAGVVSPDGGRAGLGGALLGTRPVPNAGVGALIGYLRTPDGQVSQPFMVGSQQAITSPADGRLFLLINDDNYSDNSGQFDVRIVHTSGLQSGVGTGVGGGSANERTVAVYADSQQGTDTGVNLRAGDRVTVSASGFISIQSGAGNVSADGDRRYNSGRVLDVPEAGTGALIGYFRTVGGQETRPFFIGRNGSFNAPADGRLFLLVNDDDYRDNSGSFRVRIIY